MDRIKNKSILVGKEPNNGRLLVAMEINGQIKAAVIGEYGSVPNCVSRCKPAEGIAHCRISIDNEGIMTLVNLKPQNITYVNGSEIMSKKITVNSKVELGKDKYSIPLGKIVETARKLVGNVPLPPAQPKSIAHLEKVWLEYEEKINEITHRNMIRQKKYRLPIALTSMSGCVATLLATTCSVATLKVTLPITFVVSLLYIKQLLEKDTSIEDRRAAQDKLIDNYICPYDDCKHFLGTQPYKVIRQNKKCPYCRRPWLEK